LESIITETIHYAEQFTELKIGDVMKPTSSL